MDEKPTREQKLTLREMSGEQQCYILGWTGWRVSKMWDQTPKNLNYFDENITFWFLLP